MWKRTCSRAHVSVALTGKDSLQHNFILQRGPYSFFLKKKVNFFLKER